MEYLEILRWAILGMFLTACIVGVVLGFVTIKLMIKLLRGKK